MIFTDDASILMLSPSKMYKVFQVLDRQNFRSNSSFSRVSSNVCPLGNAFWQSRDNQEKSEPVESTGFKESQISSFRADLNSNFQKIVIKSIYSHGFHSALFNLKCSDVEIKKSRKAGLSERGGGWGGGSRSSFSFFSQYIIIWAILCPISSDIICREGEKSWESSEGESIIELWSIQQQMPKVYETQD